MPSYLLSWNPARWQWKDREADVAKLAKRGTLRLRWSCGNNKSIPPGARVFLVQRGRPPRGIVGSGTVIKGSYRALHWDERRARRGEECNYVEVDFDALLGSAVEPLSLAQLRPAGVWRAQSSGVWIPDDLAQLLEDRWAKYLERTGWRRYQHRPPRFPPHSFTVLDNQHHIARANKRLMSVLTEGAENAGDRLIGHPGGQLEGRVFWRPDLDLWVCCRKLENRFWNAFGLGSPFDRTRALPIVVEVNFPLQGIKPNIGGRTRRGRSTSPIGGRSGAPKPELVSTSSFATHAGQWLLFETARRLPKLCSSALYPIPSFQRLLPISFRPYPSSKRLRQMGPRRSYAGRPLPSPRSSRARSSTRPATGSSQSALTDEW